ncbi:WG repeat-containing protein [Abyssisolibacter fermentans]|uniref:WG repeat-containing protein n=1 Tax=Abyssisolibacter fermentans TaxID=1766203 RepID=UPI00082DD648|nr:WG repeat-containing protein [Abyssisolibacter fermentans]
MKKIMSIFLVMIFTLNINCVAMSEKSKNKEEIEELDDIYEIDEMFVDLQSYYDDDLNMYGYKNVFGKVIIEPQFTSAHKFDKGVALVEEKNVYKYIDEKGNNIFNEEFKYANPFSNGLAVVCKNDKYGYINRKGQLVIAYKYDYAKDFGENSAIVEINKKYQLIDRLGRDLIGCNYDYLRKWSNGLYELGQNEYSGLITDKGAIVVACQFNDVYVCSKEIIAVKKEKKWAYLNRKGRFLTEFSYDFPHLFNEGLSVVGKDDKYGYMNESGICVIKCVYDYAHGFSEGFAVVEKDGKYGYINKNGEKLTEIEFDYCRPFCNGFGIVMKDDKYGYIDNKGNNIFGCSLYMANDFEWGYAEIIKQGDDHVLINNKFEIIEDHIESFTYPKLNNDDAKIYDGYVGVYKKGKYALFDSEGKNITGYKYESLLFSTEGLVKIKVSGEWGCIDVEGNIIIKPQFDSITDFKNGKAIVSIGGKTGVLNRLGDVDWKYIDTYEKRYIKSVAVDTDGFDVFKQQLIDAIKNKDMEFLKNHIDEDVYFDYPSVKYCKHGIDLLFSTHSLEDDIFWSEIIRIIKLGGIKDTNQDRVVFPYFYSDLEEYDFDGDKYVICFKKGTKVYSKPNLQSEIIESLDMEILKCKTLFVFPVFLNQGDMWCNVQLPTGERGYVKSDNLWKTYNYHVIVEKKNAKWIITSMTNYL